MSASLTLNEKIVKALLQIRAMPYFSGARGDSVDATLFKKIQEVTGVRKVTSDVWRENEEFSVLRQECTNSADNRDFRLSVEVARPLIVDKPNGSQQWPDALILYKKRGMAIEFKSSKDDKILWNSGLPVENGIYIFNGNSTQVMEQTTFFLGTAILTGAEEERLREVALANKRYADQFNEEQGVRGSVWSLYARPMFNSKDKPLSAPDRKEREEAVLAFVRDFDWSD